MTDCGEPAALSATESFAVNAPAAVGLKTTDVVQLAFAARVVPHVVDWVKEVASVPVKVIAPVLKVTVEVPVFLSVIACAAADEPTGVAVNVRLLGDRETVVAAPPVAVPLNVSVCGVPFALSATESAAVRLPATTGLKVMVILQLVAAAKLVPHVFV